MALMQFRRPQSPAFHSPGPETLDQQVGLPGQGFQQFLPFGPAQVKGDGLLVAGMDFPPEGYAVDERPPLAEGIATAGPLYLDHFRAKVGQQAAGGAAGHDDGQVQNL